MDVLVRDIDPKYVTELDKKAQELSKKLGEKISRNDYIKMLIQNDYEMKLMKLKEDKFDRAIENILVALTRLGDNIEEQNAENAQLFMLLASGLNVEEAVDEL